MLVAAWLSGPAWALDVIGVYERARQQAPLLTTAAAAYEEQQARLAGANALLGPQLNATWQRLAGDAQAHQASLQASQVLFDVARWRGRSAEQQRLEARAADQAHAAQQLRQDSARLYVLWHTQAELSRAQKQLARAYADEAARMGVRHREGLAAAVDWRQSQSYQWLAEANARGALQQMHAIRQALAAHAGDPALLDAQLAPLRQGALPPLAADTLAAAAAPRLMALHRERAARDEEVAAARSAAWPQLSLLADSQRDLRASPHQTTSEWRVQIKIPLWDSGLLRAGRDLAQARRQSADAALLAAEREQQRELATQWERLLSAREQHATAEGALAAAAQTVTAMRVGQEQGSRSTGDILLALQTESQLQQLVLVAQSTAWLAWIEWLAAQGRFDDMALSTLNRSLEIN
jgi:outer membrane protein TolC